MNRNVGRPRKRRTREHVIASQSAVHIERFIAGAGYTAERVENDYGYDLVLFTYDDEGYAENGHVFIQLKASDALGGSPPNDEYRFRIDIEDYNLWRHEPMPMLLVLFDALRQRAFWLYLQAYFNADRRREPKPSAKSVGLRIPRRNKVNRRAVAYMRRAKDNVLAQLDGVIVHRG